MEFNLDWRRESSELGDEVTYEIRPLKVWAFQELMAFWESRPGGGEEGDSPRRVSPAESLRLMEVAARIFPDHVRDLQGVTVLAEGNPHPATMEDLCGESPLLELAGEVLGKLVNISGLSERDEKN